MGLDVHHVRPRPTHVYGTAMTMNTLMIQLVRPVQPVRVLMRTDGLDALVETIAIFVMVFVPHVPLLMNSAVLAFQTLAVAHHVHVIQTTLTLSARIHVMYVTTPVKCAQIAQYIPVQRAETELYYRLMHLSVTLSVQLGIQRRNHAL